MIKFKLFNHIETECENEWRIFENQSYHNFFQSIDYVKNLVNFSKNKLKIIFVYLDKELIAILPFEIRNFFGIKILQWIGNDKSDYCNPLISEKFIKNFDNDSFIFLWNSLLNKLNNIDLIFLNNQPSKIVNADNPFVKFLINIKQSQIYFIYLYKEFKEYLISIKNKNKNHYYELHRIDIKLNNLKSNFNVDFQIDEISSSFNDLNLIFFSKSKHLELKNKKHFLNTNLFNLFKNLIKTQKKNYYIAKFFINKKVVSMCFIIVYNNTLYYHMPVVITDEFNKFKPGKILILHIIKWSISKKISFFDFGNGNESYKRHFSNKFTFIQKYLYFKSTKGRFIYFILKILIFLGY